MIEYWQWGNILVNNYQGEFQQGFIEVTPDAGIPYRRQCFSDIQDIFQGTFALTRVELLEFKNWYKYIIKQGSIPFQYYDCQLNVYRTCRILEKPTWTSNSSMFSVSIKFTFDSGIFYQDRSLVANDTYLLVNGDKALVVSKKLRL